MKKTITKKTKKKMPPKTPKITDVAKPGRVAPPATARPIIVTNRPVLPNDPMIVNDTKQEGVEPTAPLVNRTAKTIKPISADMQPTEVSKEAAMPDLPIASVDAEGNTDADTPENATVTATAPVAPEEPSDSTAAPAETPPPEETAPAPADAKAAPAPETPKPAAPATQDEPAAEDKTESTDASEDNSEDAVSAAEAEAEAAEAARQEKLEKLVESGTYAVPIDAVQRKRSRMFVAAMCIVALVLALALVDLALDANLVNAPKSIPHTHLFSGN